MGATEAIDTNGKVKVADQSNITGVGTITSGTWNGTTISTSKGGTGSTGGIAPIATAVTVTQASTDEENEIVVVANAATATGNHGLYH